MVSAVVHLGADRAMMVWDWQRGLRNTFLRRLAESQFVGVVQALVLNLSAKEMGTTE